MSTMKTEQKSLGKKARTSKEERKKKKKMKPRKKNKARKSKLSDKVKSGQPAASDLKTPNSLRNDTFPDRKPENQQEPSANLE